MRGALGANGAMRKKGKWKQKGGLWNTEAADKMGSGRIPYPKACAVGATATMAARRPIPYALTDRLIPMKTYSSLVSCNGNLLASIDLETTGTQPGFHEIIQIAIVPLNSDIRPNNDLPVFYQNIKPKRPERASQGATAKHGISINDLLLEAPCSEKVEDMLVEWFDRLE